MSDLLAEMIQSRKESKQVVAEEKAQKGQGEVWNFDNEHLSAFDSFFSPVSNKPISQLIKEYKSSHQGTNIVNLMGGVQLLRDLKPTKGIAVRLADTRTDPEIKDDVGQGIYTITGDVLSKSLWKRIPNGQSFIFSMPEAALYLIPINENIYYFLLNEIWKKLADGGTMFIQAPSFVKPWLDKWIPVLNNNSGMKVECAPSTSQNLDYLALKMAKLPGHPTNLPSLPV